MRSYLLFITMQEPLVRSDLRGVLEMLDVRLLLRGVFIGDQ
jgi:hypothetical protein